MSEYKPYGCGDASHVIVRRIRMFVSSRVHHTVCISVALPYCSSRSSLWSVLIKQLELGTWIVEESLRSPQLPLSLSLPCLFQWNRCKRTYVHLCSDSNCFHRPPGKRTRRFPRPAWLCVTCSSRFATRMVTCSVSCFASVVNGWKIFWSSWSHDWPWREWREILI